MATYVNKPLLDLGSVELGLDMCVAITRGIAMEDFVTRVIGVQRCHPTHVYGGFHGVQQPILRHDPVLLHLINRRGAHTLLWQRRIHVCHNILGINSTRSYAIVTYH